MPLHIQPFTLQGTQVTLRPMAQDDAQALALATSESRENYNWSPVPDGVEGAKHYIAHALQMRDAGERFPFTTIFNGRIVGSTSYWDFEPWRWPPGSPLQRTDRPDVLEIGYTWLAASAQRTRCNTEAKFLMLRHAFETWQVHRVTLRTDERNTRSRNAIARLGALFEGIRRADKPGSDGTVRNSAFFSIIQSEWPAVKARLSTLLAY